MKDDPRVKRSVAALKEAAAETAKLFGVRDPLDDDDDEKAVDDDKAKAGDEHAVHDLKADDRDIETAPQPKRRPRQRDHDAKAVDDNATAAATPQWWGSAPWTPKTEASPAAASSAAASSAEAASLAAAAAASSAAAAASSAKESWAAASWLQSAAMPAASSSAEIWPMRKEQGRRLVSDDELVALRAETNIARAYGLPWEHRGPPPPKAGAVDRYWRGQAYREGKEGGTARWGNRGGKHSAFYSKLAKAGKLKPTPGKAKKGSGKGSGSGGGTGSDKSKGGDINNKGGEA